MRKILLFVFALLSVWLLVGCSEQNVLGEAVMYRCDFDIHSLDVHIYAADFTIQQAEAFAVESNLKYLSVSEEDGVLHIHEEAKSALTYTDAMIILYVPAETVFENVSITTGAVLMKADVLSAQSLALQLGAGDVRIEYLSAASNADIEGGAGKITIVDGAMRNLNLEMGVGELNLTAALKGKCDLNFGVGKSNLTLIGSKDDYAVDIEKGIGSITVDGQTVSDFGSSGNGQNAVKIAGGVGAIHLRFQEAECA